MTTDNPFRALPSVDRLLADDRLRPLGAGERPVVTEIVRQALETARAAVAEGRPAPTDDQLVESVLGLAEALFRPSLRPVINATGVIIHTNLGRAPLSDEAIAAMAAVSRGYSNLEFDLGEGERGSRFVHLEGVLRQLTGAEAAIAVNNNASALLLALSALARDPFDAAQGRREVIVSRGQAVEIGGGFRIPDVMRQSGARLVEVGTTNRTYLRDYEAAITPETVAIMRVHASNFRIVGFTETPGIREMGRLAHEHGLLLLDDLGSGCLLDTARFGLAPEPTVQDSVAAGADLTMFSGDKLMGGPQAGIIVGRADLIETLRRHPLARAVRMDKASIAALTATLLHYLRGDALEKLPVWRMIAEPLAAVRRRARRWARAIGPTANVVDGRSMIGGGSLPEESLPTALVAVPGDGAYVSDLARRLRLGEPPVVARIERDALLLDPRTVLPGEEAALLRALTTALSP
ncbi:MAG: L-seryl-tRNA(Sec) selenium transferase [Dehalococcoidia bacterium]|nr:L-seryl-tRNA(Sec) selenium transferase [Dehalococcoidia bacterium]